MAAFVDGMALEAGYGDIRRDHSENFEPKKQSCCYHTVDKIADITDQPGWMSATALAGGLCDAIGAIFERVQQQALEASEVFDNIFQVFSAIGIVKYLKWWVYDFKWGTVGADELIAKISLTAFKALKLVKELAHYGAFSIAKIAVTVGRIPVLNVVTSGLAIIGVTFSLWHAYQEYKLLSAEQTKIKRIWQAQSTNPVCECRQFKANEKIMRSMQIDMITDLASTILAVLAVVSLCTGVGFLAASGAFMISLGIVISTMELYAWSQSKQVKHLKAGTAADVEQTIETRPVPLLLNLKQQLVA